jgi:hypothetical protein
VWPDTTSTCLDGRTAGRTPDTWLASSCDPNTAERLSDAVVTHRAEIARKVAALRQAEAATEAALARYDEPWGNGR